MSLVIPILIVIAAWWIGTGLVLYLQQRIERTPTALVLTLICVSSVSLAMMIVGATGTQAWHSYLGFISAICLWGCIELSYYTGLIGGVHTRPCPAGCDTAKRFRLALGTSIWHEISVLFVGGLVITLLFKAENPAGLYTFVVLWLMRWSAKLNLFFGVPNFNTDWFPARLAYAHSYIRRATITAFFPVSVILASVVATNLISTALTQPADQALMTMLPGVLLMLAILEHLFMALPIADNALWDRIFTRDTEADEPVIAVPSPSEQEACTTDRVSTRSQARVYDALNVDYL